MSPGILESIVKGLQSLMPKDAKGGGLLRTDEGLAFRIHAIRRGGMGVVYLCSPEDKPDRLPRFALKTFDDKFFFDPAMQMAVETESKTWLRVSGAPFVLPLFGTVSCNKKPHLMMPAINPTPAGDVSLADEIRRHPNGLAEARCLTVALGLAAARLECERRVPGLIHGDIKPDNILLWEGGVPMLADFGAARIAARGGHAFSVRGTGLYLAPECWGGAKEQSQATDTYAFGVTLFEMLAGRPPFQPSGDVSVELQRMHHDVVPIFPAPAPAGTLAHALQALALQCLAKSPEARPETVGAISKTLMDIGMEHDPASTFAHLLPRIMSIESSDPPEIVAYRVKSLLAEGDGETALELLGRLPKDQVSGEILMLYGTATSLAGDDEQALEYFKRHLGSETDKAKRASCHNEIGLSLKRLGRLHEARTLYEQVIPTAPRKSQLMLRGNYAATLIELGETDRAIGILRQLSQQTDDSSETWGLLSQALWKSKDATGAISAIQRAIQIAPRNGAFRVALARVLMDGPRDIAAALRALEVAYGLGHHTEEWLVRTLACHMLLGDKEAASELHELVKRDLSEEAAELAFKAAVQTIRGIVNRAEGGAADEDAESDDELEIAAHAPEPSGSRPPDDPEPPTSNGPEPPSLGQDAVRATIRSGAQAHVQFRMSSVDSSLLYDFYYGVDRPNFDSAYAEAVSKMQVQMMGQWGSVRQRTKPHAFAQCPNCKVMMLTQRDQGERYGCQGCGERVTLNIVRSPSLDRLLCAAMTAAGQEARETPAGRLFLAIVPPDADRETDFKARLSEQGYAFVEPDRAIYEMFHMEAFERNIKFPKLFQVWIKTISESAASGDDDTPAELDLLLRGLRREFGQTFSMSMTVPDNEIGVAMLYDHAKMFEMTVALADEDPSDIELTRTAVEAGVRLGRLEDAKRLLARLRLAFPDDPNTEAAGAAIDIAEGRHAQAIAALQKVLEARPRDQNVRGQLVLAYQATGQMDRAGALVEELRTHGYLRDSTRPEPAEDED